MTVARLTQRTVRLTTRFLTMKSKAFPTLPWEIIERICNFIDLKEVELGTLLLLSTKAPKGSKIRENSILTCFGIWHICLKDNSNVPSFEQFELSRNNIGPEDIPTLAGALQYVSFLTKLSLYFNNIAPDGAIAIAGALQYVPSLISLGLCRNNIGSGGAIAIAGALQHVPSLIYFELGSNNISSEEKSTIEQAKIQHGTLQMLGLSRLPE